MYRYIAASICFSGKFFSKKISCFKYVFQIALYAKNSNIFCKCNYDGQHFQVVVPKSEAAVYTCSLEKLFRSISHNSQESICAEAFFDMCGLYFFIVSNLPSCFKALIIRSRYTFLILISIV